MAKEVRRGAVIRVLPAYSSETRARTIHDEWTGLVATVLEVRPTGDALLVRGDARADLPSEGEHEFAINLARCLALA